MITKMLLVVTLSAVTANRPDGSVAQLDKAQPEPQIGDLSGYYTCKGLELGGKTYNGIAAVTKKNDVYMIQWMVGSGSTFTGVGIRQGDTFACSWALTNDRGVIRGVNLYRIETGPRLVGRWATLPGPGVLQTETLTFLKALGEDD